MGNACDSNRSMDSNCRARQEAKGREGPGSCSRITRPQSTDRIPGELLNPSPSGASTDQSLTVGPLLVLPPGDRDPDTGAWRISHIDPERPSFLAFPLGSALGGLQTARLSPVLSLRRVTTPSETQSGLGSRAPREHEPRGRSSRDPTGSKPDRCGGEEALKQLHPVLRLLVSGRPAVAFPRPPIREQKVGQGGQKPRKCPSPDLLLFLAHAP